MRVNDRGPFLHGRIIDLSYAAAHRLGIAQRGSGEVDVEAILPARRRIAGRASRRYPRLRRRRRSPPPLAPSSGIATAAPDAPPLAAVAGGYSVQLGAFANFANAQAFLAHVQNQLAAARVEARIRQAGGLYRVYIGPYPARNEAERIARAHHAGIRFPDDRRIALSTSAPNRRSGRWRASRPSTFRVRSTTSRVAGRRPASFNRYNGVHCACSPSPRPTPLACVPAVPFIPADHRSMIPLLRRWLAFGVLAFSPLCAQLAHAQLSIEIVGGAGAAIPIAIVPFGNEGTWPLGVSGVVGADLARSGMFRLVDTNGVVPRPVRAEDVQPAVWRARNADAVVVGSMQPLPDGRVDVRFALVDVVKQATLVVDVVHRHAGAVPHHGAQDRRHHLRKADRRSRRLLHPHRLHHQAGTALPAAGRRCRRQRSADRSSPRTSRCCRRAGRPTARALAYVSFENKKPVVYVQSLRDRRAARGRQLPRQQLLAGVVARRPPARRHADARTAARRST